MPQTFRVGNCPAHDLHATQAATNNGCPLFNSQMICQSCLTVYPVTHGDNWKVGPVRFSGCRVGGFRTGTSGTATQIIQADNKKPVGINRLAGTDTGFPPAGLFIFIIRIMIAGCMMVATESMTNQDGIGLIVIQLTIGFHHQVIGLDHFSATQGQGFIKVKTYRSDDAD